MTVTPADVANRALQLIGNKTKALTGSPPSFNGTAEGLAAGLLYSPAVQTITRQFGWDFARKKALLVVTGNAVAFPVTAEYTYPSDGVEILQLSPQSLSDANNPVPLRWTVATATVSGVVQKVIWLNQSYGGAPVALYTALPPETTWDAIFSEAVVRLLGSELAMALAGRQDTVASLIKTAEEFAQVGELRDS